MCVLPQRCWRNKSGCNVLACLSCVIIHTPPFFGLCKFFRFFIFSGFHISSQHWHMAEEWAWVTGWMQFLPQCFWAIVSKVKLITDACHLWSEESQKRPFSMLSSAVSLASCANPQSRVVLFSTSVLIINQLLFFIGECLFMKSGAFACTFANDYGTLLAPFWESRCVHI